jgi:DnaJ family protein B protein 12
MFPQGAQFEGGMTPEELFNMFFGGGGQGWTRRNETALCRGADQCFRHLLGFTTFSSGGPGFQFHVHRPGRRPQFQQQQPGHGQEGGVSWGPVLPLLIILFFSLISSLFSGPACMSWIG